MIPFLLLLTLENPQLFAHMSHHIYHSSISLPLINPLFQERNNIIQPLLL